MDQTKFANYLIVTLIFLQIVGYVVLYNVAKRYPSNIVMLVIFALVLLGINCAILYGVGKIKVVDKNGKEKKLADVFADIITVGIVTFLFTLVIFAIGLYMGYKSGAYMSSLGIPLISSGVFYISLALMKVF